MSDDPQPAEEKSQPEAERRRRMRHDWRDLIEDLIEDGRRRGVFDDLAGSGKPLDLSTNVHEGAMALANKLLKDNDLRPAWLSHRLAVQEKIDRLRADVAQTWARYEPSFREAPGETHRGALTIGWDDACNRWEEEIAALNRRIADFNLRRPAGSPEIYTLRLPDELARAGAPRYLV
jgi:hypothetical protein